MSPDLFRQIVEARPSSPGRRLSAVPVSILLHAVALAALVVIPLTAKSVLPAVSGTAILTMPAIVAPVPPVVPRPAARRVVRAAAVDAGLAPVNAPSGVGRERMVQPDRAVDLSAPAGIGEVQGTGVPGGIGVSDVGAPPPRPAGPIRLGPQFKAPIKVRDVAPVYPALALAAHVEGVVIVEAVIGPTGEVAEARVLRGKPLLDEAALAAVRQWRYTPTLLGGVPISVVLTVTVTFSLK